jgi:hypothetical protein
MIYIVYKTTNLINHKIYIGIHKQNNLIFDGYFGSGLLLNLAIKKYGEHNFIREIMFSYDNLQEARNKEREIVSLEFCLREDTYNISIGGTGGNTMAGHSNENKAIAIQKRRQTNIDRGNYIYSEEKLQKAIDNMKHIRIQPNNKSRIHSNKALLNMQNASKEKSDKRIWITNGMETILYDKTKTIPENWKRGRGSDVNKFIAHKEETKKKIADKIRGDVCYNNGIVNIKLKVNQSPPIGFVRGMLQIHDRKWITDGTKNKQISKLEPIPNGWKQGRSIKKRKYEQNN